MKLTIAATILAACIGTTQAFTVYQFWDGQNYQGASVSGTVNTGTCYGVPNGWNDRIRSMKLFNNNDANELCSFYNDAGCKGAVHNYFIGSKGTSNLNAVPAEFDKKYSSWICHT